MKIRLIFLLVLLNIFFSGLFLYSKTYLKNIRYYSYKEYTRVVLDLSKSIKIKEKILPSMSSSRLYFDLNNCYFSKDYPKNKKKLIKIEAGNLLQIRLGKRKKNAIRIVFDFNNIGKYQKFYLKFPFRIVFDIYKNKDEVIIVKKNDKNQDQKKPSTKEVKDDKKDISKIPGDYHTPKKEGKNYSLIRQLGLGVNTIVIDPGHGGKDPGTINRKLNLQEKTIVLDIAKRLMSIFNKNTKYKIVLTRSKDVYIPLEKRTAIANSLKADIFISIHLNSAPRKTARGIETYFLSITRDPWAIRVAAKENAMSTKSIGQIKSIIEKILKNDKVTESKVLSKYVQKSLVYSLRRKYSMIYDNGVKKAPFYVLIGARMPACLAEVSFLSNKYEAKRLMYSNYRYLIAKGLYSGIIKYIKSLGKR